MTISALSIAESPDPHCVDKGFQNLVKALASTRPESSITHDFPVYTTSQSRSQRCFRVSSDGGSDCRGDGRPATAGRHVGSIPSLVSPRATFRANSSHKDRNSHKWMPRGLKPATHGVFRPGRTGLRKTPSGWLSANRLEKAILVPCAWTIDNTGKPPFLVGVYDLVLPENNTTGAKQ